MAGPFTITSVSNYNSNPPSDDGSQTASNRVQWSTQKTKLSDPIYNAFNTSETNTSNAFGKVVGGAGITTTAINYTIAAGDQGKIVKATVSGITITTPDATVVGSPFVFSVVNDSSGDISFAGNGTQTVDGAASFTIPASCGCMANTDGSNWFTDGQNFNNVQQKPQGRLTPTPGTPVISSDTASNNVYYTNYIGDRVPISTNGTTFRMRVFSELTLVLNTNHLASTIYDVFLFDNSGTITIGTGPAWNNSGAGVSQRGTGAGTTELAKVHGLWTNKNSMTARNGVTTYTVAAAQGTFVGSILIDTTAGQTTCWVSWGQSRKWGISNAYNREPVQIQAGDTTSYSYTSNTWHQARGNSGNSCMTFDCLGEESYDTGTSGFTGGSMTNNQSAGGAVGVGWNSTTTTSGRIGEWSTTNSTGGSLVLNVPITAQYLAPPALGMNMVNGLENGLASTVSNWSGGQTFQVIYARWRA